MPAQIARLLQIEEAARMIGVPVASLRRAADAHGKTIIMGRAVRLHPDDLEDLVDLCRVDPKAPDSTGDKTAKSGKSETPVPCQSRPAQDAAKKLKDNLRTTSPASIGQVARFAPRN